MNRLERFSQVTFEDARKRSLRETGPALRRILQTLGYALHDSRVLISRHEEATAIHVVIDHTKKFENSAIGYHCPKCGVFYTEGLYTIERMVVANELIGTFVLCHENPTTHRGYELPSPMVFFKAKSTKAFLEDLGHQRENGVFILKSEFIEAHFRNETKIH